MANRNIILAQNAIALEQHNSFWKQTISVFCLKRNVRDLLALCTNDDLERRVHQLWQQIGQPTIQRYVVSMRQRCLAVIRARVGLSPYLINRGVILCFKGVICQGHCFKVF